MRPLMDIAAAIAAASGTGRGFSTVHLHSPSEAVAACAVELARRVPQAWHPLEDGAGYVATCVAIGPVEVRFVVFGIEQPAGWSQGPSGTEHEFLAGEIMRRQFTEASS